MNIWPSRTWSAYPGPNHCEAGCGRLAEARLTWERGQLGRDERYCAGCAEQEDFKLAAAGAGEARVSLTSIIGGNPTNEDPAGVHSTSGVNSRTEATEP